MWPPYPVLLNRYRLVTPCKSVESTHVLALTGAPIWHAPDPEQAVCGSLASCGSACRSWWWCRWPSRPRSRPSSTPPSAPSSSSSPSPPSSSSTSPTHSRPATGSTATCAGQTDRQTREGGGAATEAEVSVGSSGACCQCPSACRGVLGCRGMGRWKAKSYPKSTVIT
jgi:hypothetical protein